MAWQLGLNAMLCTFPPKNIVYVDKTIRFETPITNPWNNQPSNIAVSGETMFLKHQINKHIIIIFIAFKCNCCKRLQLCNKQYLQSYNKSQSSPWTYVRNILLNEFQILQFHRIHGCDSVSVYCHTGHRRKFVPVADWISQELPAFIQQNRACWHHTC